MKNRLNELRASMHSTGVDGLFINRLADIAWLTGYTGTTAYIYVTQDSATFITDGRYETACKALLGEEWTLDIVKKGYGAYFSAMDMCGGVQKVQPVLPVSIWKLFATKNSVSIDDSDLLQALRMTKSDEEIALLMAEYKLAGTAFLNSLSAWEYGQTENIWAAELEYNMRLLGASSPSFDTIVASGVRGALPHGTATDKIIEATEAVTIDFGSKRLYNSDYTRLVYSGDDKDTLHVADTVRVALELAMAKVATGVAAKDVDAVARDYIDSNGYAGYFNHSLGHGVGLEVHELPTVSPSSDIILEAGMVFTIEPGIYIPGKMGVRLEETVVVQDTGCLLLSGMLDKYVYKL